MTRKEEINNASYAYWVNNYANIEFIDEEEKELHTQDIQESFINGAEWADAHPDIDVRTMAAWQSGYNEGIDKFRWLSVEDELPKEEGWILICSYRDVDMWYYDGQTAKDLMDYASITHWMPLPAPPKKGGELIPRNELCKHYRSWVGTSKGEINCACVDEETRTITKCDYTESKGCWKCPKTTKEGGEE